MPGMTAQGGERGMLLVVFLLILKILVLIKGEIFADPFRGLLD